MTGNFLPKVSVLMPVRNASLYLCEALESLEKQTYREFEVIAVNDGSTDGSGDLLDEYARRYSWLRVLHCNKAGICSALNAAFAVSKGDLVARMDADDLALNTRLSAQVEFMQINSHVGIVGCWAETFGGQSGMYQTPVCNDDIRAFLIFGSPFIHPAVMMRRSVLGVLGRNIYRVGYEGVEDLDLWLRLAPSVVMANIPKPLLEYRVHATQYTSEKKLSHYIVLEKIRSDLMHVLKVNFRNEGERLAHNALAYDRLGVPQIESDIAAAWLRVLLDRVPASGWCSSRAMRYRCGEVWWSYIRASGGGLKGAWRYLRGTITFWGLREFYRAIKILLR